MKRTPEVWGLGNAGKAFWLFAAALQVLVGAQRTAYAEQRSVVLYRLTRCCPENAWTEAEYAVLKELDAMDVSVTLIDRQKDDESGLEDEIADIGRSGDVAALLYFFKDRKKGLVGVRIAIYERTVQGVSPHQLMYTIKPSVGAVSIVALKAVEAVREILTQETTAAIESLEPEVPVPAPKPEPEPAAVEKMPEEKKEKPPEPEPEKTRAPRGKIARTVLPGFEPKRFAVGFGPSAFWTVGGAGTALALDLEGAVRIVGGLRFGLAVDATFVSRDFEEGALGASWHLVLFQGTLLWRPLQGARVHPVMGVRGGPVLALASRTHDAYGNQNDAALVWNVSGEAGVAVDLSAAWGLVLGATVGAFFPEISIRLINSEVAVIGRPVGNAGARLEYRF